MFRFLPEQASAHAPDVDWLNNLITDISLFFTVAICAAMIYFAIRYRRRDNTPHQTPQIKGSHTLEIIWTVVPTLICIYIAYYGVTIYQEMRHVPADKPVNVVNVTASQWRWDFTYDNGKTFNNRESEIVVPVDEPVKFILQATDVLHSFYVPAMRVKKDAVPGHYTYLTFTPLKTGSFPLFCAEYCGKDHWNMMGNIKVVSRGEYEQWLKDDSAKLAALKMLPAELGAKLYTAKGCNACHSLDGARLVGPSWLKLYNRTGKLASGEEYTADENYIHESIIDPNKKIVEGFQPMMPSFAGQLSDPEINGIIAFIRTLDGSGVAKSPEQKSEAPAASDTSKLSPAERGKLIYETKLCKTCHSIDGSKLVGPSFKGVYGRSEKLVGGATVTVDDAYLKESILNPNAKVVDGYPPAMPPYAGQLTDSDIADTIEYLKSLK